MPNFPVRDLGGAGIISDIHPYDLRPNVFSAGVNVRFENGTVTRAPVARDVFNLTAYDATFNPAYLFSIPPLQSGAESLVTVSSDFSKVYSIIGTTVSNVTPPSVFVADTGETFTHDFLGNVVYLNRRSNVPFKRASGDATFVPMRTWDSSWRCSVIRAYKDFVIALNVKKGATEYPQMVKWSDLTPYGNDPPSWDATLTTNSAGENILSQMRGGIVDGHVLRDTMMIYGENEVWAMTYMGGSLIFDFRKRFDDVGVINVNCVEEVDGSHYVFDRNDIIVHDGASKQSIVHGKNKDFIFQGLNRDLSSLCFTFHNPRLNETHFCYPASDRLVGFPNAATGCNRAAVFNYRRQSWTFYDLPYVTACTYAAVATGQTYDSTAPTPYKQMGGTYAGDADQAQKHQLFSARKEGPITTARIIGFDLITGGRLSKPIIPELLRDAFAERIGIDLDEQGVAIRAYKSLLKIYPQIAILNGDGSVTFQFGANDVSGVSPAWDTPQAFSPLTDYQLSVRNAGRYLAHRIRHTGTSDFAYSGFDAELVVRGKR
jgi:hypothetical protein